MSTATELIISADSHVLEDPHLWKTRLPTKYRDRAPVFPERKLGEQFQGHPGGWDPTARVEEMAVDGVSGEVLYPSFAMNLFALEPELQAACFRVYNDWIVEYCDVATDRLFGIAQICVHDIAVAVAELERCRAAGLVGAMLWAVPPEDLTFNSSHYEPFWEASAALAMPISLHSLTGMPYGWPRPRPFGQPLWSAMRHANNVVNDTANAIADIIGSGVLERHPGVKIVIVESEASWLPAFLTRYDHYHRRAQGPDTPPLKPSEYFARQFYVTFFNDPTLRGVLRVWGGDVCMWSNDYPHANSTWPNSVQVIDRDLGGLLAETRSKILAGTVRALYDLPVLVPVGG